MYIYHWIQSALSVIKLAFTQCQLYLSVYENILLYGCMYAYPEVVGKMENNWKQMEKS